MNALNVFIVIALIIIVLGIFRTSYPSTPVYKYYVNRHHHHHPHNLGPGGERKPIVVKYKHLLGPGGTHKLY